MPPEKPLVQRSPLVWLVELTAVLLFLNKAILRLADKSLGHDQAWYLLIAQRFLSGAKLYGPQIRETNPPLIIWFSTIPVLLARWTGLSPSAAFYALILVVMFGCLIWNIRILHLRSGLANSAFPGLFACCILFAECRLKPDDFGQREQLVVVLMLPYILAVASGVISRLHLLERCALGFVAAAAVCFKPHYVLVIVGLELFLALYTRNLRRVRCPEFLSILLTGCLYVSLVHFLTPQYNKEVVPLLLDTYWAYGTHTFLSLALSFKGITLLTLAALLLCILLRRFLLDPLTAIALLVCSLTASIACDIQHTNWEYHQFPQKAFFLLGIFYLAADLFCRLIHRLEINRRLTMPFAYGLLALQSCLIAIHIRSLLPVPLEPDHPGLDRIFVQYKPRTSVLVLSTGLGAFSSVFQQKLNWGSRSPGLWLLPAIIQNERGPTGPPVPFKRLSAETVSRLADLQRSEVAEDLGYWQPSVVLVEQCTLNHPCMGIEGKDVDIIAWFLQSPQFSAAWAHYQRQDGAPVNFDLYIRTR